MFIKNNLFKPLGERVGKGETMSAFNLISLIVLSSYISKQKNVTEKLKVKYNPKNR